MLKNKVLGLSSKIAFRLKDKSPQILLGVGIVGFAATVVMACKATLKAEPILEDHNKEIEYIKENDPDNKKALVKAYFDTAFDIGKLYGPSAIVGIGSVFCTTKSHMILSNRNTRLLGAYKILESGFSRYRQRVVDDYGEETDKMFYHNLRKEDIEIEEDGKKKKLKNVDTLDTSENPLEVSYDRVFDDSNPNFTGHPDMDIMFLKQTQNWASEVLQARGYIFLNEVYKELGFPPSEAGQFVGWVKGLGDGYVDFGIMDIYKKSNRDFINGHTQTVLLTFNHDNYIADKI